MMLNKLLVLLRSGSTRRVVDLARELETTLDLVEMMLEDLVRMGFLSRVRGTCEGACAGCPVAGLCAAGSRGRLWALTKKGAALDVETH